MLGNIWHSSNYAAENLGITEIKLSYLRENGFLKPGIHWRSSPLGQKKTLESRGSLQFNIM